MCPVCMTTAALVATGSTSGAGVLGLVAVTFRWLRRRRDRVIETVECGSCPHGAFAVIITQLRRSRPCRTSPADEAS